MGPSAALRAPTGAFHQRSSSRNVSNAAAGMTTAPQISRNQSWVASEPAPIV